MDRRSGGSCVLAVCLLWPSLLGVTSVASAVDQECYPLDLLADGDGSVPVAEPLGDSDTWVGRFVDASFLGAKELVSADIDGDDDLDIVAVAATADDVSWFENRAGDGSVWVEHEVTGFLNDARSVDAVDLDGDGDTDILAAAYFGDTAVWWSNVDGQGRLWKKQTLGLDIDGAQSVAGVDIDGDGDLDVLATAYTSGKVLWWENLYGDALVWNRHIIASNVDSAWSGVAGDFDGDGDLDVTVSLDRLKGMDQILIYENTLGDGSEWAERIVQNGREAEDLIASDLDQDGDLDIVATGDREVVWLENRAGNGSQWVEHEIADRHLGQGTLHVVDLDMDGDLDVLGGDDSPSELLWWENLTGDAMAWASHFVSDEFDRPLAVFAADLDGDLDPDFLATSWDMGAVGWWENTYGGTCKSGRFRPGDVIALHAQPDPGSGVQGWSGTDDDDSVAWTNHLSMPAQAHEITVTYVDGCFDLSLTHLGLGTDPTVEPAGSDGCGPGSYVSGQLIGLESDPATGWEVESWVGAEGELVRRNAAELTMPAEDHEVAVEYTPTCFFLVPGHRGLGADPVADPSNHPACPVTRYRFGDEIVLIAVPEIQWEVYGWFGTDDNSSRELSNTVTMPAGRHEVGVGYTKSCDTLSTSHTGSGADPAAMPLAAGEAWVDYEVASGFEAVRALSTIDVDGDGALDVVGASLTQDEIAWWSNVEGDGTTWQEHVLTDTFNGSAAVAGGDLDGDGDTDIAGGAQYDDRVAWWENLDGAGIEWLEHSIEDDFEEANSIVLADLDGDRDLDVVATAKSEASIVWWENREGDGLTWLKRTVVLPLSAPVEVRVSDMDLDGDLDILGAFLLADTIGWWENVDGIGLLWEEHIISNVYESANSIASGDLDGDGDMDVAASAEGQGDLRWWENTSGGGDHWIEHVLTEGFAGSNSVFVEDADHDGDLDVFAAARGEDEVAWWENEVGDASSWIRRTVTRETIGAEVVVVVDIDGDGNQDVLAPGLGRIDWWKNTYVDTCSTGEYSADDTVELEAAPDSGWGVGGWVGTDDDTSVSWVNQVTMLGGEQAASVTYVEGCFPLSLSHEGSGADPIANPTASDGCAPGEYVAGQSIEIVADPDPVWVVSGWTGTEDDPSILLGNRVVMPLSEHEVSVAYTRLCHPLVSSHTGLGTDPMRTPLQSLGCPEARYHAGEPIDLVTVPEVGWEVGSWMGTDDDASMAVTNLLTMPSWRHDLSVHHVEGCFALGLFHTGEGSDPLAEPFGDGTLWSETLVDDEFAATTIAAGDLDDDGDLDLVMGSDDSDAVYWLENDDGLGAQWTRRTIDDVGTNDPVSVRAVDIDGDGTLDVVAGLHNDLISWWKNSVGDGSVWVEFVVDADFNSASSVDAGDVDGDGDADVLAVSPYEDELSWWRNLGAGETWEKSILRSNYNGVTALLTDLDGDGDLDAVSSSSTGFEGILWWENLDGDGDFSVSKILEKDPEIIRSIGASDVDGDGDLDLVGARENAHDVVWWENPGSNFGSWTISTIGTDFEEAYGVLADDFDGDGDVDVAAAARSGDEVRIWENMDSVGSYWMPRTIRTAFNGATVLAAGDLNSDGDLDLVGGAEISRSLIWWENGYGGECGLPEYFHSGDVLHLSAFPDEGFGVAAWSGTDDDDSRSVTNQATMPPADHEVGVNYVEVGDGPLLSFSGNCPGVLDFQLTGATPNRAVGIAVSERAGTTIVPGGPCAGTLIGLDAARLLIGFVANEDGETQITQPVDNVACGSILQAIDIATCEVSSVVQLP